MDEAERARLSADLFEAMARIVHRTAQDTTSILRAHGLNVAQWQLLRTVHEHPGVTQAWLVQHRGVTAGGVSMLVSRVEEAGLLRREAQGAANLLWLTTPGERLVDHLLPAQESFFVRRFGSLSDSQLRTLRRLAVRAQTGMPEGG